MFQKYLVYIIEIKYQNIFQILFVSYYDLLKLNEIIESEYKESNLKKLKDIDNCNKNSIRAFEININIIERFIN